MVRRRSGGLHKGKAGRETGARPDAVRPAVVWDELGGYRLLRVIGRGDHSDVYLGADEGEQVVVKAYHEDVDRQRIGNEVGVLASIRSPHVVRLIDTSLTPGRPPCLVLERLSGGASRETCSMAWGNVRPALKALAIACSASTSWVLNRLIRRFR